MSGRFDPLVCQDREPLPGDMPGLVRLTHLQYDNAVLDLLGVDARARSDFVADQTFFGFDNNAENLAVPQNQALRYRTAAERIAEESSADLSKLAEVVPCVTSSPDAACQATFVADFLKLMFRRPLSQTEREAYLALFGRGAELYDEGAEFSRGVRIVLEAALQSPHFLYRAELRDGPLTGAVVPLSSHEMAARLALALWSSAPDRALMAKADKGELASEQQIEQEARRMLEDPKAQRMLDDFHRQWLEFDKLKFAKDSGTFPGYDEATFAGSAKASMLEFARHTVFAADGSFADLMTSPVAFVDAALADAYGVAAPSAGFSLVELDAEQRAGLFTQLGFLAGHSDTVDSSPIHRGAYVQKRALCATFGPLPGNVGNLPERTEEIVTTRDQVEAKTEPAACAGCHARINPAGFAFEHFDSLGRFRTQDHGQTVDATGTLTIDGEATSFDGAVELAQLLADSEEARRCYETQWFRYVYGRGEADDDVCLLNDVDARLLSQGGTIKEMLVGLTMTRGFRFRAREDL